MTTNLGGGGGGGGGREGELMRKTIFNHQVLLAKFNYDVRKGVYTFSNKKLGVHEFGS